MSTDEGLAAPVSVAEHAMCPATDVMRRVGEKWSVLVLSLLAARPYGFNELDRAVEGLSRRVLTRTLRTLERDGLISRTALPGRAARVEYALTDLGRSLRGPLLALGRWAVEHDAAIRAARDVYDQTPEAAASLA
ncbi:helix-turn-helix transcriptional regulator [Actinomadura barringtoniae]|uniref:Helix-turn-helix transcriptional regulator n=1 Tax=Actinomadura barringtoniae TaxID=1427535 RepID=A0A939PB91_9ACTN|nr:helix-turn-helix domain-containing protein [Actinomadura barringtoniae]MBO2449405.1 helix-turn-helix transcriptional regulator [Actinomadura barringtoniae]